MTFCPVCRLRVSRWHEHHGPFLRWKPGMDKPIVDRRHRQPTNMDLTGVDVLEREATNGGA